MRKRLLGVISLPLYLLGSFLQALLDNSLHLLCFPACKRGCSFPASFHMTTTLSGLWSLGNWLQKVVGFPLNCPYRSCTAAAFHILWMLRLLITHFNSGPSQARPRYYPTPSKRRNFEYMKGDAITMFRSVSARSDILHDCILRHV